MTISSTVIELVKDSIFEDHLSGIIRPSQFASAWQTVIAAGLMDDDDNTTAIITNPAAVETARDLVNVGPAGTTLLVCLQYDDGVGTVTANAVIEVFGRCITSGSTDPWQRLYNKQDTPVFDIPMTIDTTNDVADGTDKWTMVDSKIHAFDLMGFNQLLFAVKTLLNTDANDAFGSRVPAVVPTISNGVPIPMLIANRALLPRKILPDWPMTASAATKGGATQAVTTSADSAPITTVPA